MEMLMNMKSDNCFAVFFLHRQIYTVYVHAGFERYFVSFLHNEPYFCLMKTATHFQLNRRWIFLIALYNKTLIAFIRVHS